MDEDLTYCLRLIIDKLRDDLNEAQQKQAYKIKGWKKLQQ